MTLRRTFHAIGEGSTTFDFVGRRWRAWTLSLVLIAVALLSLFTRGLNLGIDFEGGTSFLVKAETADPSVGEVRDVLAAFGLSDAKVAILGDDTIRVQTEELQPGSTTFVVVVDDAGPDVAVVEDAVGALGIDVDVEAADGSVVVEAARELDTQSIESVAGALAGIEGVDPGEVESSSEQGEADEVAAALGDYAGVAADEVSISEVGPTFGEEVTEKARNALVLFFVAVAAYLTLRFKGNWKMAVAALIAVVHDILITVGVYSVTGFEVTPATVIAFLTILGFSLYDTVVVFDRVAEHVEGLGSTGRETYSGVVNRSMNQVLARSLSTSLVAVLPVLSLLVVGTYVFGAPTIRDFALALFVGLVAGTYSSIYIATPVLAVWKEREPRYRELRHRVETRVAAAAASTTPTEPATEPEEAPVARTAAAGSPGEGPVIAPRGRKQRGKRRRR